MKTNQCYAKYVKEDPINAGRFKIGTIYSIVFEVPLTVRVFNMSGQRYVGTILLGAYNKFFRELTAIERALYGRNDEDR